MDFWTIQRNKTVEEFNRLSEKEREYLWTLSGYIEACSDKSATSVDKMEAGIKHIKAVRNMK